MMLMDPEGSWWAKHRHVIWHLQQLATMYDSYYESRPFKIEEEPTDQPEMLAARLHPAQPEIRARQPRLRAGDPGGWPTLECQGGTGLPIPDLTRPSIVRRILQTWDP